MVALTGVEPDGCQFSSVQLGLSSCVFSTVGVPGSPGMPPRAADVTAQSQRSCQAGGALARPAPFGDFPSNFRMAPPTGALTSTREAPINPAPPGTACASAVNAGSGVSRDLPSPHTSDRVDLLGHSYASRCNVESIGRQMSRLLIIVGIAVVGGLGSESFAQDPGRPIRSIGEFSDVRYTEGHAYGYSVELWRDGNLAIGLFFVSEGLEGDSPAGMLDNVRFDSRTGALSFAAKLTAGVALLPGGRQEPSRDLFEFTGTLKATVLTGT